jgi:hypothetical protein
VTSGEGAGCEEGGEDLLAISPEERDALHSQATYLLRGIGAGQARIDQEFSDDLGELLDALAEIDGMGTAELAIPPEYLRRVMSGLRDRLPEDPAAPRRSARTRLVSETCDRVLAQLGGAEDSGSA